ERGRKIGWYKKIFGKGGGYPIKNACNGRAPIDFLRGKGMVIIDENENIIADPNPWADNPTGAAYVLVSHGATGHGAWLSTGNQMTPPVAAHIFENDNVDNDTINPHRTAPPVLDQESNDFFDDVIRWKTLDAIASEAGLTARAVSD
ncbi:MAG: hypothetical protein U9N14_00285, partial [Pseudomonadota bacterium]|nr:hypothetical protein [Pseudomonadota bacterium]